MNIKRFTLRTKLIFSTFLMRHNAHEEKGFIYEFDDVEELKKNKDFKKLSRQEQGQVVQRDWNRYMEEE